jgi:NAD(P)-dependent dehydrogenase (short-subunit alcohol dehydrogenase family)
MIGDLKDKVAFITGAAGGIGLGMARAFAQAGMKVAITDIDAKTLKEAGAELEQAGATVFTVPLDVTDLDNWQAAREAVERMMGPVKILCNNAGVSTLGMKFDTISPELWGKVVDINLNGVFNGVHTFLDGMRAAGGGHIVNTSSMGGMFGVANLSSYVTTKFAVVGLSEALRAELAEDGIGVSVLCPGSVRSRLWRTSRPIRGLPDIDVPPDDVSGQSALASGMDPYEVGLRVVNAVRQNQLYIFTHAEFRAHIAGRSEKLMAGFDCTDAYNTANLTPA